MNEASTELRIVAADARGLSTADRACIKEAADEYDAIWRELIRIQEALIDSHQQRIATNDQLIQARRELAAWHDAQSWLITINAGPERYGPLRGISEPYTND